MQKISTAKATFVRIIPVDISFPLKISTELNYQRAVWVDRGDCYYN